MDRRIASTVGAIGMRRLLCVGIVGLVLGACTTQRPLPIVLKSGDDAYLAGDYGRASQEFQEYIDRFPGDPEVRTKLARSYVEIDQPAQAVRHAQVAYDINPRNPFYIETLAEALYHSGRSQELFTFLGNLAKDRGGVTDYIRQGQYLAKAGFLDEAKAALLTAAKIDLGKTPAPQLALADFYESINDRENALLRLRYALYLDPKNPDIQMRIRALGEVPGPAFALPPEESPSGSFGG